MRRTTRIATATDMIDYDCSAVKRFLNGVDDDPVTVHYQASGWVVRAFADNHIRTCRRCKEHRRELLSLRTRR